MELDFSFRRYIDHKHSKFEEDISPGVEFNDVPDEAESIALIMEDKDADGTGSFTNWVIWNIPTSKDLEEDVPGDKKLDSGAVQGNNDYDEIGYGGPKPPRGAIHEYRFKAYALDKELNLSPASRQGELEEAISGHVIEKAEEEIPYGRDFDQSEKNL